jgi:hypothetical protein
MGWNTHYGVGGVFDEPTILSVAVPLILGSDPRALSPSTISMLENREVLAVDQDRLGIQGTMIAQRGSGQVWAKPLSGGQVASAPVAPNSVVLYRAAPG